MSKTFVIQVPISGRVRECLEFVKLQKIKDKTVVDIGSSFGWLEKNLATKGAKLIGVEPDAKAVDFANKHFGRYASFVKGDALNIPVKDNFSDLVIFFDVVEHVPKSTESKALKEIHRILKKDGIILLTTPNSYWFANLLDPAWYLGHRHYSKEEIRSLLESAGFAIKEHRVKGRWASVLYMFGFYFAKWVFQQKQPSKFMQRLDDDSYKRKEGFVTHYIKAKKI